MKKVISTASIVMLLAISLILPVQAEPPEQGPPPGPPGPTDEALVGQLQQETGGEVRISYHAETGKVRFIGTSPDRPIAQPAILAAGASSEVAARGFLATSGQLFGLSDQAQELTVMRSKTVDRDRSFVHFRQVYQGVPVLGGELIIQLGANKDVVSANGEVLPEPKVNVVPTIGAETARQRALAMVAKNYGLNADALTITEPELWIYNPILLGGLGPRLTMLVWRMDVEPRELLPIRELVLVDAHLGVAALHFNQIDAARNRLTYDANNGTTLPGTLRCNESNPNCTGGDAHEVAAHRYAGATYDFYFNQHGRDSLNNAGMPLISTVHYGSGYANAFWSGSQMVYGDAYGFPLAEDVVAHEMTHGVTQYESKLFYYMQSGAINESLSDIWGEFVDLVQVTDNDAGDTRWAIGEDVSGLGAMRSMSNPPAYGDPDRMGSTYYVCGEGDNGGVHSNSGVGNKAAYLMVDGGSFNGYTVTGMGIPKVAKIWYEVQTNLFTSAGDYQDLYDDLYQACTNLIGTSGITAADCQEVRDATDATEMNQQPTSCPATHAPVCASGSPTNLFFDNMENTSSGNWTSAAIVGSNRWYYPQTANPYGFDATYATSGVYNIWGYDQPGRSDFYIRMTLDVALPAGSQPYLHFNHAYAFEDYGTTMYDGGVLEYSTNGGSSWNDAGSLFTHNGYNGTIATGYSNPLQGRQAFVGESNGYFSSRLNLSSLAGQSVRFRFRIGTDSYLYSDAYGWFIDDVRVYTCSMALPDIGVSPASFEVSVDVNEMLTRILTINNTGTGSLTFYINEVAGGFTPTGAALSTAKDTGHVSPEPSPVIVMPSSSFPPGWADGDVGLAAPVMPMDVPSLGPLAWAGAASMPTARARLASATDQGCLLYTIGGRLIGGGHFNTNEVYDPNTNAWTSLAPMPTTRSNLGAAVVNGVIYVPGGYNASSYLNTHETYNIAANSWSSKAPLPVAAAGGVVAAVNGKIYHIGGNTSSGDIATTYEYNPTTNSWSAKTPAPGTFAYAGSTVLNGYIYIAGGWSSSTRFWRYDPVGDNWTVLTSMSQGRQSPGLVAAGGYIYAFGGGVGWTPLSSTEQYNPSTNTWTWRADSPLAKGRIGMAMGWVRGRIWGAGGSTGSGAENDNEYLDEGYADNCGGDDVPWLSEDPTSGTVSAGGSLPVDVIFNSTGLAQGDYTANLVIYNNDPDENPVTVPVVMHVVPGGAEMKSYLPIILRNY